MTLRGDGELGDDHINLARGEAGDQGIELQGYQFQLVPFPASEGLDQLDVMADELSVGLGNERQTDKKRSPYAQGFTSLRYGNGGYHDGFGILNEPAAPHPLQGSVCPRRLQETIKTFTQGLVSLAEGDAVGVVVKVARHDC